MLRNFPNSSETEAVCWEAFYPHKSCSASLSPEKLLALQRTGFTGTQRTLYTLFPILAKVQGPLEII